MKGSLVAALAAVAMLAPGKKQTHKAYVWAFRSFNRAHSSVVTEVNVADFESSTFARKTTGTEC